MRYDKTGALSPVDKSKATKSRMRTTGIEYQFAGYLACMSSAPSVSQRKLKFDGYTGFLRSII